MPTALVRTSLRRIACSFGVLLIVALSSVVHAADPGPEGAADEERVPTLLAFGASLGFPSYQVVAGHASLQTGALGFAARIGYGPGAGGSVGLTARLYPPLPGMPVPVWAGAGAAWTGGGLVPHAAVGVHVPIAPRWRIDVEGGVAVPRLGVERRAAPHVAIGMSYAFAIDAEHREAGGSQRTAVAGALAACEPGPPDPSALDAAIDGTVRRFVSDARASYGSLYRDLRYDLSMVERNVHDDRAEVRVRYDGSVREIASGDRVHATGDATARFAWTGCAWRTTDLAY